MKVSIITPFYKGNAYMRQYAEMIQRVEQHLAYNNTEDELEVVLVNDSPDVEIIIPQGAPTVKSMRILQNETNQGIHKSRIRGLEGAGHYQPAKRSKEPSKSGGGSQRPVGAERHQ